MNNIFILQNELENVIDGIGNSIKATDDEKIIAVQLALNTLYKIKNTRCAYVLKSAEDENKEKDKERGKDNGNTNEKG